MVGRAEQVPVRDRASKVDFSQGAVARAVLASTLQQPQVLYPTAVGVLGFTAALALGPSLLFVIPAIAGTLIGVGGWAIDYFLRRNHHAGRYLQGMHQALAGRREEVIRNLRTELETLGYPEGLSQLARLQERYRAFAGLLGRKLSPNELTYGRYLGMAEQVFLAGLDNLQRIVDTLSGIRTIDVAYIGRRKEELERVGKPSETQRRELETLQDRLVLRQNQLDKVHRWQAQNEQAMTQMDQTMAAIAAMTTVHGHAATDLETAMRELQTLAARASEYSLSGE